MKPPAVPSHCTHQREEKTLAHGNYDIFKGAKSILTVAAAA